jgi:hypothetical protein
MSYPFLWIIAVHFKVVPLDFMLWVHCTISGCRHEVPGNCAILGCYTYNSEMRNKALRISLPLKTLLPTPQLHVVSSIRNDAL